MGGARVYHTLYSVIETSRSRTGVGICMSSLCGDDDTAMAHKMIHFTHNFALMTLNFTQTFFFSISLSLSSDVFIRMSEARHVRNEC